MKMIFEEYGDVIVQILGGLGILFLLIILLRDGGALREFIVKLIESAC